jgi:hypothetical protein
MHKGYTLVPQVLFESAESCPSYVKIASPGSGYLCPRNRRRTRSIYFARPAGAVLSEGGLGLCFSARGMNTCRNGVVANCVHNSVRMEPSGVV